MLRGWGPKPVPSSSSSSSPTKQTKTTKTTIKLFHADEPFAALPPRPQGLAKDSKKSGWKEGIVTLNPRTPQEYKVFVQWGVTVPGPVYKEFVERVCAQAAREHDHGFVLIRSCLHATSRAGTKPTVNNGKPVPTYKRDDPHITAGFGPPLSSPSAHRIQTESAHVYCGYPPTSHGGPSRRPPKGQDDHSIMTIWREGCLGSGGRWGIGGSSGDSEEVAEKRRITWWRVEGSVKELDNWRGMKK